MEKLYKTFEDLLQSHEALFRAHKNSGAISVCRGVWQAREPEINEYKNKIASLEASLNDALNTATKANAASAKKTAAWEESQRQLANTQSELDKEKKTNARLENENAELKAQLQNMSAQASTNENRYQVAQKQVDDLTAKLNSTLLEQEQLEREIKRLQQYETTLDKVQRSQFAEIESLKKRYQTEAGLRAEIQTAFEQTHQQNEKLQLEIVSKDDLIVRLQARIEDLESRAKQQQRLNARMGAELDRFARENEQLARAINN